MMDPATPDRNKIYRPRMVTFSNGYILSRRRGAEKSSLHDEIDHFLFDIDLFHQRLPIDPRLYAGGIPCGLEDGIF
jgi:hypothetical protein